MVIQETVTIDAPLSVVWQTFSRMEDWDSWNTACRNCCIISGDEALSAGTCFSFTIRPLAFPLKVRPRIVRCDPGREVVWEGGKWGIHASHTWQFQEENGKVILLSVEQFKGPMVWAGRLLQVPRRLHRLTREFLHTLKNAAEACSGST